MGGGEPRGRTAEAIWLRDVEVYGGSVASGRGFSTCATWCAVGFSFLVLVFFFAWVFGWVSGLCMEDGFEKVRWDSMI